MGKGIFSRGQNKIQRALTSTTKKKKQSSIKVFDSLNLWTRVIADLVDKGRTDVPEESLGSGQFYYSTNRIYTQRGVKKIFFLHDLPSELARGFVSDIREAVRIEVNNHNLTHGLNEYCTVALISDCEYFSLDLDSRKVQGRWKYFAKEFERVAEKLEGKTLQDELKSDKYSDNVRRKVNSFLYIKDAKEYYHASFFKSKIILEFWADSNDVLEKAEKALRAFCFQYGIVTKDIFIQTNEYQKSYTPMSLGRQSMLRKMNEGDVFTDDTLSSLTVSTHGLVGDKIGVYHGIDIQSRNLFAIDFTKGEDVKNILVSAASGEGKSNFMKMLYTFYSGLPEYATVIFDYEGIDYIPLGKISDASIIAFGEAEGSYVNTMVIGELTGNREIDVALKTDAMTMTERVFNILFDEDNGMSTYEQAIFSDLLKETYLKFGVTEDSKTWHLSKNCTFFHIYAKAKEAREDTKFISRYGQEELNRFVINLSPYFEEGATKQHWFKTPVSITEIINTNNLIISFGMAGKGEGTSGTSDKSLALRQMFASYLTTLLANKNKAKGIFTVVVLEELQRYLTQRFSGEIVAGFCTGGRKLNMIVYCVTNTPSELIDLTENSALNVNIGTTASKIMSNISTVILGALSKNDMNLLSDYFGLENALNVLYQLSDVRENNIKSGGLKHCFFVRHRGQSTVVKMLSHPDLAELPLYKTVKNKKNKISPEDLRIHIGDDYETRKQIDRTFEKEQKRQKISRDYDSRKVSLYPQKMKNNLLEGVKIKGIDRF